MILNHEKSCGCIILREDEALLISTKDDDGKLFWSFPKGHQEEGENDKETAIRETKEEVGLDVEIVDEKPIRTGHLVKGGTVFKELLFFVARPKTNEVKIQKDEVVEAKWIKIGDVDNLLGDYYLDAWVEMLDRSNK